MQELNDFFNAGFGWTCRRCDSDLKTANEPVDEPSRLMREGEAETKEVRFSNPAMAKWADPGHRMLTCPRCGITELVDIY